MVDYYLNTETLIVDINRKMFITVDDYAKHISNKPEDYNYKDATYKLNTWNYNRSGVLLNNNQLFLDTLKYDGQNLYRNLLKEVLK